MQSAAPFADKTAPEENGPGIVIQGPMTHTSQQSPQDPNRMLSSKRVMELLDYHCKKAFWRLVHSQAIPHVRYNARVIKFPAAALDDWIRQRRSAA